VEQEESSMIIGLSGKKGSGKTTLARYLHRQLEGSAVMPFAGPLKDLAMELFGCEAVQVNGDEKQKTSLALCGLTGREVMQRVGAAMRDVWPDCWVHAWKKSVVSAWAEHGSAFPVIVDDVRYPNEVEAIRDMGGIVIRLNRHPLRIDDHESETALDDWRQWDVVIEDIGIEETKAEALQICRDKGII
jgi:hypothetical protein